MRLSKWVGLVLLLLCAGVVSANGPAAVRKQTEASMLVAGHVSIEIDGSVSGWEIDQKDKLPAPVADLVDRALPEWRFEPVVIDGQPRRGRASMSLRIVANRIDDQHHRLAITAASFGKAALDSEERLAMEGTDAVQVVSRKIPSYPMTAMEMGARGTVYVVLRIGRDGRVQDAVAEQVNLRVVANESGMARMRTMLAGAATRAASQWTFQPPTTGDLAGEDTWSGRIAFDFVFAGERSPGYGEWHAYIPGPRQHAPWLDEEDMDANQSPDTMVAGEFEATGQGVKLLTPLGDG